MKCNDDDQTAAAIRASIGASPLPPLLQSDEPAPASCLNPQGRAPLLLVCDHASAAVPRALGTLGADAQDLRRHIGWDLGAAECTHKLSRALDAPAVLANYSRLVVDCNRYPSDPELVREVSDGTVLARNIGLSAGEREQRLDEIYWPYQQAVGAQLARMREHQPDIAVVSIHSFSPALGAQLRPWHFGVLWDRDGRVAQPLMRALAQAGDVVVGDNEPYSGAHPADFTLDHHAELAGLAHAAIEIRQDLIDSESGRAQWCGHLGNALAQVLNLQFNSQLIMD